MSSLVLILAMFLRKRRSFIRKTRLMSWQMRRMRQAIQSQKNIHKNFWLPLMWGLILHADAVKQARPWTRGSEHPKGLEEL